METTLRRHDREKIFNSATYYITELQRKLAIQHWTRFNVNEETVVLVSPKIAYSFEGVNLTIKHMSQDGWKCTLRGYFINNNDAYVYTFVMSPPKQK